MEDYHMEIFQWQLLDQFKFIHMSAGQIDAAVRESDLDLLFFSLQNFLNAAANCSKILWGSGARKADVRAPLRESIGISDDSPLKITTMRNNFEHLDDRIDRWWLESPTRNFADRNIGNAAVFLRTQIDTFRTYDPSSFDVGFWGESFNIRDVYEEVERILPALEEAIALARRKTGAF